MSNWLLSIVGVTVIGVLVELLLTDSPMSKFVRSIYAFFILFVIVQPIPGLLRNSQVTVSGGVLLDNELLQTINANSAAAFQRNIENALNTAGFAGCIVTIQYDKTAPGFKIDRVYVNAWNSAKKDAAAIIQIVTAVCNVKPEAVEVYV